MAVVAGPKIKLSQVLDPAQDLEVPLLDEHKILEMRQVYITLFVDAPMEACEVTDSQVSALQYVLSNGMVPYADFGVWGPYGTRFERRMLFPARILESSGTWKSMEVPGPVFLESWRKCWRVYAAAAVTCGVASPATLTRYETRLRSAAIAIISPGTSVCRPIRVAAAFGWCKKRGDRRHSLPDTRRSRRTCQRSPGSQHSARPPTAELAGTTSC